VIVPPSIVLLVEVAPILLYFLLILDQPLFFVPTQSSSTDFFKKDFSVPENTLCDLNVW
jgi:hypothetical protein